MKITKIIITFKMLCIIIIGISISACDIDTNSYNTVSDQDTVANIRIINGDEVTNNRYGVIQTGDRTCTGTLLTNDWIISAKHCFDSPTPSSIIYNGEEKTIIKYIHHSDLDVSLVRVEDGFNVNGSTSGYKRNIYSRDNKYLQGKKLLCQGYGRYTESGGSGTLRQAYLKVARLGTNRTYIRLFKNDRDQKIYKGDSGGPCFYTINNKKYLTGVHSYGWSRSSLDVGAQAFRNWVKIVLETSLPSVKIVSPQKGDIIKGLFKIDVEANHYYGVTKVEMNIKRLETGNEETASCTTTEKPYSCFFLNVPYNSPHNKFEITVKAYNRMGAYSKTTTTVYLFPLILTPFLCSTYTDTNINHLQAGRAHVVYIDGFAAGIAANGSDANLGSIYETSTISETSPGYYRPGNCYSF